MPRKIGVATNSALKLLEFQEHFRRYGVEVHQIVEQLESSSDS